MCLLSYYESGIIPDTERLRNGTLTNADGCGYAIASHGKLITSRGLDAEAMIAEFAALRATHPDGPALFHSRFSTGGTLNTENCHPYAAGGDPQTVIAHNGVFFTVPKGETRSDTRIFAEEILPRKFRRLDRHRVQLRLNGYLGSWNKVAIITVNPRYQKNGYLFNKSAGVQLDDGEWHSNYDYRQPLWLKRQPAGWYYGKYDDYDYDVLALPPAEGTASPEKGNVRPDCELCLARASVDPVSLICGYCRSCYDCGLDELECSCYDTLKNSACTTCWECDQPWANCACKPLPPSPRGAWEDASA